MRIDRSRGEGTSCATTNKPHNPYALFTACCIPLGHRCYSPTACTPQVEGCIMHYCSPGIPLPLHPNMHLPWCKTHSSFGRLTPLSCSKCISDCWFWSQNVILTNSQKSLAFTITLHPNPCHNCRVFQDTGG